MKSALITHSLTDCNDRLAAFAGRQLLIFIQFSPLFGPFLSSDGTAASASNHSHQSVTGGRGGGGDRFAATTWLHRLRSGQDLTTVRNLASIVVMRLPDKERGGLVLSRKKVRRNAREIGQIPSRLSMRSVTRLLLIDYYRSFALRRQERRSTC